MLSPVCVTIATEVEDIPDLLRPPPPCVCIIVKQTANNPTGGSRTTQLLASVLKTPDQFLVSLLRRTPYIVTNFGEVEEDDRVRPFIVKLDQVFEKKSTPEMFLYVSGSVFGLRRAPMGALRVFVLSPDNKENREDAMRLWEDYDILLYARSVRPLMSFFLQAHSA